MGGGNKVFRFVYLILWLKRWNKLSRISTFILNHFGIHFYNENGNYSFQSDAMKQRSGINFFIGGWHNPMYFNEYSDDIKRVYNFPEIKDEKNIAVMNAAKNQNAVAIHVRGGDYMKGDFYKTYGIVCNQDYYKKAITIIETKVKQPQYYIFTNDISLSEKIFSGRKFTIVNSNIGKDAWKDMALMSKFHNIIISNSTFSWWAAYLGSDKKNVICPKYLQHGNLTSDIFLKEWIRVEV